MYWRGNHEALISAMISAIISADLLNNECIPWTSKQFGVAIYFWKNDVKTTCPIVQSNFYLPEKA
jgi:hypothetical protein